jgi:AhpD family alkylhydroperoxidase
MSDHYHSPEDGRRLKEMRQLAPGDYEAWLNLNKIIGREDGAIPRKFRELIAVAVSCTTQCPYCIEAHAKAAKAAGATREELVEASLLAAALRAGAGTMHGTMALRFFDQT